MNQRQGTVALIVAREGQFWLEVVLDGETILAPLGDGRYHAQQVFEKIIGPAIAPRISDDYRLTRPRDRVV